MRVGKMPATAFRMVAFSMGVVAPLLLLLASMTAVGVAWAAKGDAGVSTRTRGLASRLDSRGTGWIVVCRVLGAVTTGVLLLLLVVGLLLLLFSSKLPFQWKGSAGCFSRTSVSEYTITCISMASTNSAYCLLLTGPAMGTAAPLSCGEFRGLLLQAGRGCCWYLLELAQKNSFDADPFIWLLVKRVMVAVCSRVGTVRTVQWDVGLVMALGWWWK